MRISWRARLEQQPQWREFGRWPVIPIDTLPRARRKPFLRNQQLVAQVLQGARFQALAQRYALSPGRISQLMQRCLGGEDDAPPALTQGLIPYRTVVEKMRLTALPTLGRPRGTACAFAALLRTAPAVREALDAMIAAKLKDAPYAQRVRPQALHGTFKRALGELHWPRDRYPYTTATVGYPAVRRYLHARTAQLQQQRLLRRTPSVRNVGLPAQRARAQRAVQIDEHVLDCSDRIHLWFNDEMIPLRIARASVLTAVDVDTGYILGYHLAPTGHPNQQDLLTLLERCVLPWQPMRLATPGLTYAPGARFPSANPHGFPISFGTVQLDNALMHRAQSIVDLLCHRFGATLSLGLPSVPKVRGLIESVFHYMGAHCTHRVASTTGSAPTDPDRESRTNRKKPPAVTFQTVDEALSVQLTEYNITPQPVLGGNGPLAAFEHQCANHFVRIPPPALQHPTSFLVSSAELHLCWYRNEHRAPHVNFLYVRYHGPGLRRVCATEKRIRVTYTRTDIRTLKAYTLAGEDLGTLHASFSWQRFPHSVATRQWLHKHARRHGFNARDPLASYFHWLLEHRGKPKVALSLLRVYNEFTAGRDAGLALETEDGTAARKALRTRWSPERANHKGARP